jgi:hypothetical protein
VFGSVYPPGCNPDRVSVMPDTVSIRRALISVSDKSGLVAFAQALA